MASDIEIAQKATPKRINEVAARLGIPAIAVPSGFNAEGLPLSLQIMGPHFAERALFRAAGFFEGETGYWRKAPRFP